MAKSKEELQKSYVQSIVSSMVPSMRSQEQAIYDYLLQLGQRQGIPAAMRDAAKAVAPFAEAGGTAAAKAGTAAENLAQRESEYERQLEQRQAEFEAQKGMWEKSFEATQQQQKLANIMAVAGVTGLTPEMLGSMGYNAETLGLPTNITGSRANIWSKFEGRNPAINRLMGSTTAPGTYSFGGTPYSTYGYQPPTTYSGSGGAALGYSTPAQPFRRISPQAGQGPGLIKIGA